VISHQADAGTPGLRRFDPSAAAGPALAVVGDGVMSTAEQEINAARSPKFASLQAESEGNGKLGVRRVPGAGPHPGNPGGGAATTGPLPAFRSSPQPADADFDFDFDSVAQAAPTEAPAGFGQPEPYPTSPLPAVDLSPPTVQLGSPSVSGSGSIPAATGTGSSRPDHGTFGREPSRNGDVVVPPAEHVATANRLPIFEAVESDWFRRGRSGMAGWPAPADAAGGASSAVTAAPAAEMPPLPEVAWTTPSDRGWEAAAAVSSPSTGGTTSAGLPKRVPQANLVPGAAAPEPVAPAPARSASATRERFASFQRGSREGRAAAGADDNGSDQEDGS
jgi:hypothetical protein